MSTKPLHTVGRTCSYCSTRVARDFTYIISGRYSRISAPIQTQWEMYNIIGKRTVRFKSRRRRSSCTVSMTIPFDTIWIILLLCVRRISLRSRSSAWYLCTVSFTEDEACSCHCSRNYLCFCRSVIIRCSVDSLKFALTRIKKSLMHLIIHANIIRVRHSRFFTKETERCTATATTVNAMYMFVVSYRYRNISV